MRPALLRAYRQTNYEVVGIRVRIGRRSDAIDRLLLAHRAGQAVFITAYNPFSRRMPAAWNRRMQLRLSQALRRRPIASAKGTWRRWSEDHLVVFGDPRPTCRVARRFRQNSIVLLRLRQPAKLVGLDWCRTCERSRANRVKLSEGKQGLTQMKADARQCTRMADYSHWPRA